MCRSGTDTDFQREGTFEEAQQCCCVFCQAVYSLQVDALQGGRRALPVELHTFYYSCLC